MNEYSGMRVETVARPGDGVAGHPRGGGPGRGGARRSPGAVARHRPRLLQPHARDGGLARRPQPRRDVPRRRRSRSRHVVCEDIGMALGMACAALLREAIPDGVEGVGSAWMPMDEALAFSAVSFEGRSNHVVRRTAPGSRLERVEDMADGRHGRVLRGLRPGRPVHASSCEIAHGEDPHHSWEAACRAFGVALRDVLPAVPVPRRADGRREGHARLMRRRVPRRSRVPAAPGPGGSRGRPPSSPAAPAGSAWRPRAGSRARARRCSSRISGPTGSPGPWASSWRRPRRRERTRSSRASRATSRTRGPWRARRRLPPDLGRPSRRGGGLCRDRRPGPRRPRPGSRGVRPRPRRERAGPLPGRPGRRAPHDGRRAGRLDRADGLCERAHRRARLRRLQRIEGRRGAPGPLHGRGPRRARRPGQRGLPRVRPNAHDRGRTWRTRRPLRRSSRTSRSAAWPTPRRSRPSSPSSPPTRRPTSPVQPSSLMAGGPREVARAPSLVRARCCRTGPHHGPLHPQDLRPGSHGEHRADLRRRSRPRRRRGLRRDREVRRRPNPPGEAAGHPGRDRRGACVAGPEGARRHPRRNRVR